MKTFLLSFFCILLVGSSYAQRNANAFSSIMTSAPVEGKTLVTDVTYKDGAFNGVEKRLIKHKKSLRSTRNDYVLMGHIIDSLKLIDYKADTLYVLCQYYIPGGTVSELFKVGARNDPFYFVKDTSGEYVMKSSDIRNDGHTDPSVIESDSIFYNTIYSWDIDKLLQMIKVSGGLEGAEYFMSATRIIIQDNKVVKKDIVNFKPSLRWHKE